MATLTDTELVCIHCGATVLGRCVFCNVMGIFSDFPFKADWDDEGDRLTMADWYADHGQEWKEAILRGSCPSVALPDRESEVWMHNFDLAFRSFHAAIADSMGGPTKVYDTRHGRRIDSGHRWVVVMWNGNIEMYGTAYQAIAVTNDIPSIFDRNNAQTLKLEWQ